MDQLETCYKFYLNSEDRHDDLLSLQKSRAHGGTMTLWKTDLDPYISIIEPSSSRVLAMVLDKPGHQTSIHINIYLHTAGTDPAFLQDLAILEETIDDAMDKYSDAVVYVRGDANASLPSREKNLRDKLFDHFIFQPTSKLTTTFSTMEASLTPVLMSYSTLRSPVKVFQTNARTLCST